MTTPPTKRVLHRGDGYRSANHGFELTFHAFVHRHTERRRRLAGGFLVWVRRCLLVATTLAFGPAGVYVATDELVTGLLLLACGLLPAWLFFSMEREGLRVVGHDVAVQVAERALLFDAGKLRSGDTELPIEGVSGVRVKPSTGVQGLSALVAIDSEGRETTLVGALGEEEAKVAVRELESVLVGA